MDILDRLTNKAQLQQAYDAKNAQLTTIDAEDLANKLKARESSARTTLLIKSPLNCGDALLQSAKTSR
jgi:hypothetical protein